MIAAPQEAAVDFIFRLFPLGKQQLDKYWLIQVEGSSIGAEPAVWAPSGGRGREEKKNKKKYQQNLHMQNNLQLVEHFNKNRPVPFFSSFFSSLLISEVVGPRFKV